MRVEPWTICQMVYTVQMPADHGHWGTGHWKYSEANQGPPLWQEPERELKQVNIVFTHLILTN